MATFTILWFGGPSCGGLAETPMIVGGGFETAVVADEELFEESGSGGADAAIFAVLGIVEPCGVAQATLATSVNDAVSLGAIVVFVQESVPPPPGAGVVHVHPAGAELDTNEVPAGSVSLIVTPVAVL